MEECIISEDPAASKEHKESVKCSTVVEVIFLHASDCAKLIGTDKLTVDLLRQAAREPPPDDELLDAHFANTSWAKFKENLQVRSRTTAIEEMVIWDQFPALPLKPPKAKQKQHKPKLFAFMQDHREFRGTDH